MKMIIKRLNEIKNINLEYEKKKIEEVKINKSEFKELVERLNKSINGKEIASLPTPNILSTKMIELMFYKNITSSPKNKCNVTKIDYSDMKLIKKPISVIKEVTIAQEKEKLDLLEAIRLRNKSEIIANKNKVLDLKMNNLNKRIEKCLSIDKVKSSTNKYSKFDDDNILNLPKISLINYSDINIKINSDNKKKSIIDLFRSCQKINKEDIENYEELKLFQKALNKQNYRNNKLVGVSNSSISKDTTNATFLKNEKMKNMLKTTCVHIDIDKYEGNVNQFRNLFVIKKSKNS